MSYLSSCAKYDNSLSCKPAVDIEIGRFVKFNDRQEFLVHCLNDNGTYSIIGKDKHVYQYDPSSCTVVFNGVIIAQNIKCVHIY